MSTHYCRREAIGFLPILYLSAKTVIISYNYSKLNSNCYNKVVGIFYSSTKSGCRRIKPAISLKRLKIEQKLLLKPIKLEVHGRARREAARRRKSECKVNLLSRNSSRSNGSWWMTPKKPLLVFAKFFLFSESAFTVNKDMCIWTCVKLQYTSSSAGSICAL